MFKKPRIPKTEGEALKLASNYAVVVHVYPTEERSQYRVEATRHSFCAERNSVRAAVTEVLGRCGVVFAKRMRKLR